MRGKINNLASLTIIIYYIHPNRAGLNDGQWIGSLFEADGEVPWSINNAVVDCGDSETVRVRKCYWLIGNEQSIIVLAS